MTAGMNPGAPRPRPTIVSAAGVLLYFVAALQIVGVVLELTQAGTIADATQDAYRGTSVEEPVRLATTIQTGIAVVLGVLFTIGFVVLAIFNNRGRNPSRITTWVVGGIALCCSGVGLIGSAVGGALPFGAGDQQNLPDPAEVQQQIEDALPSWYTPVTIGTGVVALLALLAALILLALPPANEFFRRPAPHEPVWQPPAYPPPGYPQSGYAAPPPGGPVPPGAAGGPPPVPPSGPNPWGPPATPPPGPAGSPPPSGPPPSDPAAGPPPSGPSAAG